MKSNGQLTLCLQTELFTLIMILLYVVLYYIIENIIFVQYILSKNINLINIYLLSMIGPNLKKNTKSYFKNILKSLNYTNII